jgi:hypothetical protein
MTDAAMSLLRRRMIEDMTIRKFAPKTQHDYALTHHPHVHMIVPGGGISLDGKSWISCRPASSCRCACSRACSAGCSWPNCSPPTRPTA